MEIFHVIEIVGIQKITEVPDMPEFIRGVINLRGNVIPVMDVRLRFGMPDRAYDDRTCMIVVRLGDISTALIVDRVNEVSEITSDQIEPPPRSGGFAGNIRGWASWATRSKFCSIWSLCYRTQISLNPSWRPVLVNWRCRF